MDRFSETIPTYGNIDRDEDGYPEQTYSPAGPQCQNCMQTVERVSYVEGFDYWGCDDCRAEAEAEDARELAEQGCPPAALLVRAGCTAADSAAFVSAFEKKVA